MTVIRWENPPQPRKQRWSEVADDLAQRPGKWALVAEDVTQKYAYHSIRKCLVREGCEVQCRVTGDGARYSVWARMPFDAPCVSVDSSMDSSVD